MIEILHFLAREPLVHTRHKFPLIHHNRYIERKEMAQTLTGLDGFPNQFHRVKLLVQHRSLSIQLGKTIVVVEIKRIAIVVEIGENMIEKIIAIGSIQLELVHTSDMIEIQCASKGNLPKWKVLQQLR